jgi:hypothetical protein
MHVLKKVGTTLLAGGVVGTFATAALGTSELLTVGDYGNYSQSSPDGNSDRIVWDSVDGTVTFVFVDDTGLNVLDSSGELVDIVVSGTNGTNSGYGRNATTRFQWPQTNPFGVPATNPSGWFAPAVVDANASAYGGFGAQGQYYIDGPAGSYYFNGVEAGDDTAINNIAITSGGTGYMPGNSNSGGFIGDNALVVSMEAPLGGDLGSFGFLGTDSTDVTNNGFDKDCVDNIAGVGTRTADVLNGNRAYAFWITGDNATAGNYRVYLGHTPAAANGTAVSYAATAAGEVANLDIRSNSTQGNSSAMTSGIGYTDGTFMIYDADGNMVDGVAISYTTDDAGRVYSYGQGSYLRITEDGSNNTAPSTNTNTNGDAGNYADGWAITNNNGTDLTSSAGWTVVPQGNGFGFDCRGVHLWGQVTGLPAMGTNASGAVSQPIFSISANATGVGGTNAMVGTNASAVSISTGDIPTGTVTSGWITAAGENYNSAPEITTAADDSGTGAVLTGILGGVGNRMVSQSNGTVIDGLAGGYICYANGDFNGDGNSDLVFRNPDIGTAIWNMGADARLISAGFITDPGADWELVTLGKFGYDGVGCCLFWYNLNTGQTAIWAVNSNDADPANWVLGGAFTDTVDNLNYSPNCGNNVVQNAGSAVYWQDSAAGNVAYWPVRISSNASSASTAGAAEFTFNGDVISFADGDLGYTLMGVGNMNGRPVGEGISVLRDAVLTGANGTTAVWTMDSDWTTCLSGAFTTYNGVFTEQSYEFAGVGQYATNVTYTQSSAVGLDGNTSRLQWMYNMHWSAPGAGTSFTWMMDRNIQLVDIDPATGAPTGSGELTNNAAVVGTGAVTFND